MASSYGYRGRGRSSYRGARGAGFFYRQPHLPPPLNTQKKLSEIWEARSDSDRVQKNSFHITKVKCIASYNWIDAPEPTILVPGKPPRWQPPAQAQQLEQDNNVYYRDPNGARFPTFQTEPAVRAIFQQLPVGETPDADIFGCGNSLGSLLSFARDEDRTFRFGVERIGGTIFFVRKTNSPYETINEVRGYGHTFPEAYTTWEREVKRSVSHQRIIQYEFGGLKCLVRSECDGYFPGNSESPKTESDGRGDEKSDLTELLEAALSSVLARTEPHYESKSLKVESAGTIIEQESIFDIKTRSIQVRDHVSVDYFRHRLWVNQTPHLILAFHRAGNFHKSNIHIHNLTQDLQAWEVRNRDVLDRYHRILTRLIELSQKEGHNRFEVRRIGMGPLEIWSEVDTWSVLPTALQQQWQGQLQDGAEDDHGSDAKSDVGDGTDDDNGSDETGYRGI